MKVDFVKSLIAVAISALLAYACYEICDVVELRPVIKTGSFLTILIPALLTLSVTSKEERSAVMLRTLSSLIFFLEVALNFGFSFFAFKVPVYVILNGLLLLLYALVYRSIFQKHQ